MASQSVTRGLIEPIIFDLFDANMSGNDEIFAQDLSKEEKNQIVQLVSELDNFNSRELINFATQEIQGNAGQCAIDLDSP